MATLREQRRQDVDDRILTAAWQQLRLDGAAALSLRAVAREVGVSPSALYRYYPSRDDLLTELLVRSFEAQADAVEAAAGRLQAPVDALRAAIGAYREWALANPAEFTLTNGTPVPGYRAPAERTVQQGARVGDFLVGLVEQAWRAGLVDESRVRARYRGSTSATAESLAVLSARRRYTVPDAGLASVLDVFVRVQGFVLMEVFGQLRPLIADPNRWFAEFVDLCLADMGLAG